MHINHFTALKVDFANQIICLLCVCTYTERERGMDECMQMCRVSRFLFAVILFFLVEYRRRRRRGEKTREINVEYLSVISISK